MSPQLQELSDFLHQYIFVNEGGSRFRFINDTININGSPVCKYSIYEKDDKFYIDQELGLTTTKSLWVTLDRNLLQLKIIFYDEINNKHILTLSTSS